MIDNRVRVLLSVSCTLMLVVGAVGTVAGTNRTLSTQTNDDRPALEREPVEFTALDSGDEHIEVVFENAIYTPKYNFTVQTSDGEVVAHPEVNSWFTDTSEGYVWLDIDTDLHRDDLVLSLEVSDTDERYEYDLTTTDSFVQHDYPERSDTSVSGDSDLAILNLPGRSPTDVGYEIRDGDGETVVSGSTGADTFVSVEDVSDLDASKNYTVGFDNPGGSTSLTVSETVTGPQPPAPSSDDGASLPAYIESRSVESVNDEVPFEPGTTVSFGYDLGRSIGNVDVVVNSTEHVGDEMTIDQLGYIPEYGVQSAAHDTVHAEQPPGEVVSAFNLYFDEGTEPVALRVPVFVGQEDYGREDLRMLHYDNGTWHDLNATVVEDEYWSGYHQVTLEGHANSTSLFVVVSDS